MRWVGHAARLRKMRNAYKIFAGKLEDKRPLGRLRRRWEHNIRMDLREMSGKLWTVYIWLRIRKTGTLL
jgi:hypothetical protein